MEDWEHLPETSKTWTVWKRAYLQAHFERKRLLCATGGEEPFRGHANSATVPSTPATYKKLNTFLDNLENSATMDNTRMKQLMEANKQLVAAVAALTLKVNHSQQAPPSMTPITAAVTKTRRHVTAAKTAARLPKLDSMEYCWLHRYMCHAGHTSATCYYKKDGHKAEAARENPMGGLTHSKGW